MSDKPSLAGFNFSQTATLADGAAIDTSFVDMATADKYQLSWIASASGLTLETQTKSNIEDSVVSTSFTYTASTFFNANYPVRQRYVRLILTNNTGSEVTDVNLEVKTTFGSSDKHTVTPLAIAPTDSTPAALVKSVIAGKNNAGSYENVIINDGQLLSSDFFTQVALGNVPGYSTINVQATNSSVGTTFEDLSDQGGITDFPTAAESWELVSSNANDTALGTGVRTVAVNYLDDSYVQQSQVVTMNGTTPVALTGTAFRTNNIIAITAGSNKTNLGIITLRVAGGGATRLLMNVGNSRSFSSFLSIPAGITALAGGFSLFAPKNDDVEIKVQLIPFGADRATVSGGSFLIYQSGFHLPQTLKFPVAEKTDIKYLVRSTNASVSVTSLQDVLFKEN